MGNPAGMTASREEEIAFLSKEQILGGEIYGWEAGNGSIPTRLNDLSRVIDDFLVEEWELWNIRELLGQ